MVQSQESGLKIGVVAAMAGVSIDTVRYYERRGVLPPADRLPSGFRLYPETTVARIGLARHLQGLGMTLDEVADALRAHQGGEATCASERWRLEAARDRVDERLAELRRTRRAIDAALKHCAAGRCELTA